MLHQLYYRLRNNMNTYRAYTKAVEIINCDCGRSVMNIITGKFKLSLMLFDLMDGVCKPLIT